MKFIDTMFNKKADGISSNLSPSVSGNGLHHKARRTMMALESRIVFDGAVVDTVADTVSDANAQVQEATDIHQDAANFIQAISDTAPPVFEQSSLAQRTDIFFIDPNVGDTQSIINALPAGAEYHVLDGASEGVAQITAILSDRHNVDSINIVSEGGEGHFVLGTDVIWNETLDYYATSITSWGSALTTNGDIAIYGCDLAASGEGQLLVNRIADMTHADVAASTDLTGAAQLGGDWQLEYQTGDIAVATLNAVDFQDTLATFKVTNLNDAGAGSLRAAVLSANGNGTADTIVFDPTLFSAGTQQTITLTSGELDISGNNNADAITIIGPGANLLAISGNNASRIFAATYSTGSAGVSNTSTATLSGMTLTNGKADANSWGLGGAIVSVYSGGLSLTNMIIKNSVSIYISAGVGGNGGGGVAFGDPSGNLLVSNSMIYGNTANGSSGAGGLYGFSNTGSIIVQNSSISGNTNQSTSGRASYGGGAMLATTGGSVSVSNTTFYNNTGAGGSGLALTGGSAIVQNSTFTQNHSISTDPRQSGALWVMSSTTATLNNNILFGNTASGGGNKADFFAALSMVNGTKNIIGVQGNYALQPATISLTSTITTNPTLGALANNGGFVKTVSIGAGGSADNTGSATGAPTTDARGYVRSASIDIGAFEVSAATTFNFVGTLFPANGFTDVPSNNNLYIDFGEPVTAVAAKNIVIYKSSDNSVFESIPVTDPRVTIGAGINGNSKVTINPTGAFASLTGYYVLIDGGAFTDAAGKTFNGITNNATWAFTSVVAASNTAPTVTGTALNQVVNDTTTVNPFSAVTIADVDANNVTATITPDTAAKGVFTAASLAASGFSTANGGATYTHAATTPALMTTAIRALVFDPTNNRVVPTSTETTTFTIAVNDGTVTTTSTNTTSVVSTSVNDAPSFFDAGAGTLTLNQNAGTTSINSLLRVVDLDTGQTLNWSITVSPGHGSTGGIAGSNSTSGSNNIIPATTLTYTATPGYAGTDSFTIGVTDSSGASTTRVINVNVIPIAPSTPDLATASDSGSNITDNITNATSLNFTGTSATADTTSTVRVFLDKNANGVYDSGTDPTATATINNGSWSVTGLSTAGVADGTYNVYALTASAIGSLTSVNSTPISITIDKTAPSITNVSIPNVSMKVGDTVTATLTVANDGGNTYTLGSSTIDGFTVSNLIRTSATTYTAQFTVTEGGADIAAASAIPLSLILTDTAGNSNTAYTTAISQAADAINAHTPTSMALSTNTILTSAANNTVVGALSSTDATSGDTFTYTLVAGAGSTDNASFNISGGNLQATNPSGLTVGAKSVRVRTTDAGGNFYEQTFSITVSAPVNTNPVSSANTGLTVLEDAAITTITTAMLNVTDAEQAAGALTYTITTASTKGVFSKSGAVLGVGGTFTQADINSGIIKYTPNLNANGSDSVGFSVSDGAGGTLSGQTFNFTITPVSDVNIVAGITPVEGAAGTFTITLDSAPAADLVVNYTLDSASTATLTTDYTVTAGAGISAVTAGTITILAGQTSATLNINALTDAIVDPSETVILKLATGAGYQLVATGSSFAAKADYPTGTNSYSVSTGDFNGDGKLDLVVANHGADTLSVLLGTGTGTFAAAVDYATGINPRSVTTGDFNGDGRLDIAVANLGSATVSVLLGTGTGTFAAKVDYATGINPHSVTTGDFNGDGRIDMAVANRGSNTVSVLLGTGTGTFVAGVDYATGLSPRSVTTGDFNGDGKLDMVVANFTDNTVSVLQGTGTGTFVTKVDYPTGASPHSVTTGDFNGDGILDLAVAKYGNHTVSVLLGTGAGTFAAGVDYATGLFAYSVTAGDFNGDGKLDLAVTNMNSNSVSVLLGTGTGTFAAKVDYTTGILPYSVTTGDFNGDGKLDMAVANWSGSTGVSVFLNNATSTATLTITDVLPNNAPTLGGTFTTAGTVNDNATIIPFSNVTVNDAESNNVSITITYTAANGTLAGAGLTGSAGNYTLTSASLATVQSNLRALVFTPTANQVAPASTVQTIFTLTPNDGTVNGTANATTSITATSINDAPTATNLNTPETYTEDTALNLTDIVISDVDIVASNVYTATLTLSNIAAGSLSTATSGAVTSTYNAGTGVWSASGSKADVNALLAGVTFNPALNFNSSFNIATSISDGIAAAVTGTKAFTGVAVNDAPVLDNTQSPTLTAINEDVLDASNTGSTIASIVVNSSITDADYSPITSAPESIAVSAVDNTNGVWQYKIGAGAWIAFDFVANSGKALLLDSADSIRFVPNANWNGTVSNGITFYAWDKTSGSAGAYLTVSGNTGGAATLSTATDTASIVVTAVNDAPVASGSATLAAVLEDISTAATGATVSSLFTGNFSDVTDTVAGGSTANTFAGIAISNYTVDAAKGAWQYQIGAGAWTALSSATTTAAITLASTDSLRFVPAAGYNGAATALSANLIESGVALTSGAVINLTSTGTGGITGYSSATVVLNHTITAVNDAPIGVGNLTLAAVNENALSPAGAAINSLTGFSFTDVDTGASLSGVAVVNSGVGNWQYSTNGGTNWYSIGTVSLANTLVLAPTTLVRYLPLPNYTGTPPALQVKALDNTYAGGFSTAAGAETRVTLDATVNGGATAISNNSNTISTSVTDANPVISNATVSLNENSVAATAVTTVTATTDTNGLIYSITGGNTDVDGDSNLAFSINASTGAITVNDAGDLNFENTPTFSLTVAVDDEDVDTTADSTATITVNLQNLDEVAPTITSGATATAINENSGAAQVIYTATSTDAGDIATGATAYSLSGADAALFSINSATGAVILTANPNFEVKSSYSFNVIATDAATNASSKAITLAINDLNEAPAITSGGTLNVAENSTGTVYTATGTDPDTAQTLSWSISGTDAALFSINSTSGALTFNTVPNFELPADNGANNVYDLTVVATDNGTGNLTASKVLTITVTNVNEAPTTSAPASISVVEDVALALTGISFADVDAGNSSVTATLAVNSGTLIATSGGGVTVTGSGTTSITLAGTLANINAFIASSAVSFTTAANSISTVTLSSSLNDNGNSGSGGALNSAVSSTTLTVTGIADTPSVASLTINEDIDSGAIAITRNAADGAEVTHYKITGITGGTLYSDAGFTTAITAGSFIASSGATTNVYFRPTANSNTAGAFTVQASTSNADAGLGGATAASTINITPIADTASVTGSSTTPAIQTTSGLVISRNAVDGAEVTHFKITNIANGTLYQNDGVTQITANSFITFAQANAGLKFTPSGVSNGSFDVQASTGNVDAGLGGAVSTATISLGIVIANANINEDTSTGAIAITGNTGFYKITGLTGGTLYSDAGFTTAIVNGGFIATSGATTNVYFRPAADFNGTANFTVQGSNSNSDAGLTGNTATSTITVNPVNDAPTGSGNLTLLAVDEDTVSPAGAVINTLAGLNFTDVDAGASLSGVAVIANTANATTQGVWQYSTNGGTDWYNIGTVTGNSAVALSATSSVRFIPVPDFNGTPSGLTVRALDNTYAEGFTNGAVLVTTNATINGGSSAISANTNTIDTRIAAVNDAPVFSGLANTVNFTEDGAAIALGSLIMLSDVDLNTLSYADATLTLVRNGNANADDVFANTGTLGALTQGGNLTVNGVVIGTVTSNSAGLLTLTFNANATKALVNSALQQITYSNSSNTPPASVQIMWLFNDNNTGAQGKGAALSAIRSTTVNITPTNDAPIALNDRATVVNGGTLNGSSLLANDSDPENDALTVSTTPITNVAHGTLTLYANGSYLYQHDGSAAKTDSFVYEITDGHGGKAQATVTMTISGSLLVNQPTGNVVFLNNLSVFFDNFLTSGSLILLSNCNNDMDSDSRYVFEDKKHKLDHQYNGDYALPSVHLSLYVPLRYHVISVAGILPTQTLIAQEFYVFKIPKRLFQHRNPYETLKFTATNLDGKALPEWIKLNPKTLTFFGLVPKGAQDVRVMMTIGDQYGNKVHSVFTIHVTDKGSVKNVVGEQRRGAGKSGFSEQLYSAGKVSKLQESRRLLNSLNQL